MFSGLPYFEGWLREMDLCMPAILKPSSQNAEFNLIQFNYVTPIQNRCHFKALYTVSPFNTNIPVSRKFPT